MKIARIIDLIDQRDFDAIAPLLHPEYEFHAAIGTVDGTTYAGVEGLRRFVGDMEAVWDGYHVRLGHIDEASDQAVAVIQVSGIATVSGVPLDQTISQVLTWRDGLLFRTVAHVDHSEALRAVGLRA